MYHYDNIPYKSEKGINVIVEIPQHSQDKYEIDEEFGVVKLDRALYSAQVYPANYGFVPQTLAEDGDHMDVLVYTSHPLIPGAWVEVRPIGYMEMIDGGDADHKIIGVPVTDPRFDHITKLEDLGPHKIKEVRNFFENIKVLQNKKVEVGEFKDATVAWTELEKNHEAYKNKK